MPDILNDILLERKKLLEVAEANAKNKIIETITPKIQELVANALLGRLQDGDDDDDDILFDAIDSTDTSPAVEPTSLDVCTSHVGDAAPCASPTLTDPAGLTLPSSDGKVTLDLDAVMAANADPQAQSSMPNVAEFPPEFDLTPEVFRALGAILNERTPLDLDRIEGRLKRMESVIPELREAKELTSKHNERARQLKLECEKIFKDLQEAREFLDEARVTTLEERLESIYAPIMERYTARGHIVSIAREMLSINARAGKLKQTISEALGSTAGAFDACVEMLKQTKALHESVEKLLPALKFDDSVDEASVRQVGSNLATLYTEIRNMVKKNQITEADDLDLGADVAAGDDAEAAGGETMLVQFELPVSLKDLAAGSTVGVADVKPADESGAEEGMESDDAFASLDDLGDDAGDDVGMDDEVDVSDDDVEEGDLHDDDLIELDEAALVAELKKMQKLIEKKEAVKKHKVSDFGGGKDEGEKFVDGQDLNQSDDVGSSGFLEEAELTCEEEEMDEESSEMKAEAKKVRAEGAQNANPRNKQLAETVKKLRAELAEQKMFSTKLVALNRILQMPGLKKSQHARVISVLDEAKTSGEVMELYSRIEKALRKETVNESASVSRAGGSRVVTSAGASRQTESAPLLERWNKIAFGEGNLSD
jgi:hypothetical protein